MELPHGILFYLINEALDTWNESELKSKSDPSSFSYYFAYGSTMNQACFERKVGKVECVGRAVLENFQLVFAKTPRDRFAKATLIPKENVYVEGVIYKITKEQLNKLDKRKGISSKQQINVLIKTNSSEFSTSVELHFLDLKEEQEVQYSLPRLIYIKSMLQGAKNNGVSNLYCSFLQDLEKLISEKPSLSKL